MNELNRRMAINLAVGTAVVIAASVVPAWADGFLEGTFWVYCKKCKKVDKVEDLTRNHDCETDGCDGKSVDGGTAYVACPDGHWKDNKVEGITRQHQCQKKLPGGGVCNKQCRGPFTKPTPKSDG